MCVSSSHTNKSYTIFSSASALVYTGTSAESCTCTKRHTPVSFTNTAVLRVWLPSSTDQYVAKAMQPVGQICRRSTDRMVLPDTGAAAKRS